MQALKFVLADILSFLDIFRLEPFRTLDYIEGNLVSLSQGFEATGSDSREMHKDIATTVILLDKTKPLAFVEPLDCACCHRYILLLSGIHYLVLRIPASPAQGDFTTC